MFNNFGDYMYSLLFTPLKKIRKQFSQYYIFFRVMGTLYDDSKRDILRIREEASVLGASNVMLPEHGKDREMPRLPGETVDGYRIRLAMKAIIAEMAGTIPGIVLSLRSMGYPRSYIEPMYLHDPERWAEFMVFLIGDNPTITDLRVIASEVMQVKHATSMPVYAKEDGNLIEIGGTYQSGLSYVPCCNTLVCGVYPDIAAVGRLYGDGFRVLGEEQSAAFEYPYTGQVAASTDYYQEHAANTGFQHGTHIHAQGWSGPEGETS